MKAKKNQLIVTFFLGFGLFMFTRYCRFLPDIQLMIIIAPIFILRFSRLLPKAKAVILTIIGFLLSFNIALWGLFEFDNNSLNIYFNIIRNSVLGLFWSIPFIVDRFVYPKFKNHKILSTLTFPVVITSLFFILTIDGPFDDGVGTTSSMGYTYNSLIFEQIRSVFGIWILIFTHSWLISIINYLWENNFRWVKTKHYLLIYSSLLGVIFMFGFAKINFAGSKQQSTVKIALAVLTPEDGKPVLMSNYFSSKKTLPYGQILERVEQIAAQAAQNEAKIISFQEYALLINEKHEPELKKNLQEIALQHNVYLSFTYAYYSEQGKGENKHLFIDGHGELKLEYTKRYLLGLGSYGETGVFKKGAEQIQYADTEYGRIALSICRDAGFSKYMRQAAKANVDIMLSPSYDWPKSFSAWYLTAAIENGFSLVRPTYNGYSYASDYNGHIINHMQMDQTQSGLLYSNVPIKGITTIYGKIGDVFGWISSVVFLIFVFIKGKRLKTLKPIF